MRTRCWECGCEIDVDDAYRRDVRVGSSAMFSYGSNNSQITGAAHYSRVDLCPECAWAHDKALERNAKILFWAGLLALVAFGFVGILIGVAYIATHKTAENREKAAEKKRQQAEADQNEKRRAKVRAEAKASNDAIAKQAEAAEAKRKADEEAAKAARRKREQEKQKRLQAQKERKAKKALDDIRLAPVRAAAKLKLIKMLIEDGLTDIGKIRLQQLIKQYPKTKAAEEAKDILKRMKD